MRQWLEEHPVAAQVGAIVILLVSGFIIYRQFFAGGTAGLSSHVWFYDVQREELIPMPRDTVSPTEVDGGEAVRAYVVSCSREDEPEILYLEKLTPEGVEAKRELENIADQPDDSPERMIELDETVTAAKRVRRPDDEQWHDNAGSLIYQWTQAYRNETCGGEPYVVRTPDR